MAWRYQVDVTITSGEDLKNVNWRHGNLKPYAVAWVDPKAKSSTPVDHTGDTSPYWDYNLTIPFDTPIDESTLHIDIVHADAAQDTKPLIGSARLPLRDLVGFGTRAETTLQLKRPSGRPQGKVHVHVSVSELGYRAPDPYGVAPPATRDYAAYGGAPPSYGQPAAYGQSSYYGGQQHGYMEEEKKSSKFGGMGTGLAVGAVAGVLGGLAISEGVDALEENIADDVAEDLGYDDGE